MTILRTAIVVLLLNLIAHAQPAVTASDAWIVNPPPMAPRRLYLTINNPTMYDIYVDVGDERRGGEDRAARRRQAREGA